LADVILIETTILETLAAHNKLGDKLLITLAQFAPRQALKMLVDDDGRE